MIISILKTTNPKPENVEKLQKVEASSFHPRSLKPMPSVANIKYHSRIEIDSGGEQNKIETENFHEKDKIYSQTNAFKKDSKFMKKFFNR
jgi:hypothetical protein